MPPAPPRQRSRSDDMLSAKPVNRMDVNPAPPSTAALTSSVITSERAEGFYLLSFVRCKRFRLCADTSRALVSAVTRIRQDIASASLFSSASICAVLMASRVVPDVVRSRTTIVLCNPLSRHPSYWAALAGAAGFGPAYTGVKVPCLTTWLHPIVAH